MIIKNILLISFIALISACSLTEEPAEKQVETKQLTHQPITQVMHAFLSVCENNQPSVVIENAQLAQFISDYCETDSTNKQLKLISDIENQAIWPSDYQIWFASLTWHTENLRKQKISNFYSDSKAQKHQQQLLELQKQLIELKQKLVDIEKQRLESSL